MFITKKKILFSLILCVCIFLTGCSKHDRIDIHNKPSFQDNMVHIDLKDGYYYDSYEKFTIDDNTIGVTIYFSNLENGSWDK
ncbi:MAG: hypothetical protein NC489_21140 [Ruminococcus flavefaciens]|nr:hypothetical protein [Ruminococcus flavefaciens]